MNSKGIKIRCVNVRDDSAYILTDDNNDILKYNTITGECEYLTRIKRENLYFCTSEMVKEKIYYFSFSGTTYCVFDTLTNEVRFYDVDLKYDGYHFGCCSSSVVIDNMVYIFGGGSCIPLLRLDTETNTIEAKSDWITNSNYIKSAHYAKPEIVGDNIWFPTNVPDLLISYNCNSMTSKLYELPKNGITYHTINYDGNNFWLSGNKRAIVKWNNLSNELKMIDEELEDVAYEGNNKPEGMFYTGIRNNSSILFYPLCCDSFVSLDINTEKTKIIGRIESEKFCFWEFQLNGKRYCQISNSLTGSRKTLVVENGRIESNCIFDSVEGVYRGMIINQVKNKYLGVENHSDALKWYLDAIIKSEYLT